MGEQQGKGVMFLNVSMSHGPPGLALRLLHRLPVDSIDSFIVSFFNEL
jgi:hypothetical protein